MEGLGEFLKKGRQRANLSLDDLSKRTRIRIENLQSLEREDLESLPSDAYVRGFVRQICREVGIPPQDGIVRYEMLRASSGPPDEITWSEDRAEETAGRLERALEDPERVMRFAKSGTRWAGIGMAALAAVLILVFGWQALKSKPQTAKAEGKAKEVPAVTDVANVTKAADPPAAKKAAAPPKQERRVEPKPEKRDTRKRTAEPRTTIRADTGAFPAVLPDVQAPPPKAPETKPEVVAESEPRAAQPEATSRPAFVRTDSRVVLEVEAVRSVEVAVLLDGTGQPRRATLLSGERRRWKAEQHFVLSATDGGALRIYVNGRDLGLAGEAGHEVIRTLR